MFTPNNPPAFPGPPVTQSEHDPGMELRDYFAAAAIPVAYTIMARNIAPYDPTPDEIAKYAGRIADAMIAERATGREPPNAT